MYRYYYRSNRNVGLERARAHIEDAERLTRELGGTDQDVKDWFFNRKSSELKKIFKIYEDAYGTEKADYARSTYEAWKNGTRRMSGTVAERLFEILPSMMPLKDKYSLVDTLWQHVGPSRKRLVKCGGQTPIDQVIDSVSKEVRLLTTTWEIPTTLTRRFQWLSGNDSTTYQKLLSHFKSQEKQLGERTLKEQIPQLRDKYNEMSDITSRLSYIVDVGKQSVELRVEGVGADLTVSDWYSPGTSRYTDNARESSTVIWWLLGTAFIFYLLVG
jgi:hypothetical protein